MEPQIQINVSRFAKSVTMHRNLAKNTRLILYARLLNLPNLTPTPNCPRIRPPPVSVLTRILTLPFDSTTLKSRLRNSHENRHQEERIRGRSGTGFCSNGSERDALYRLGTLYEAYRSELCTSASRLDKLQLEVQPRCFTYFD